jgi:hypothetical protein
MVTRVTKYQVNTSHGRFEFEDRDIANIFERALELYEHFVSRSYTQNFKDALVFVRNGEPPKENLHHNNHGVAWWVEGETKVSTDGIRWYSNEEIGRNPALILTRTPRLEP